MGEGRSHDAREIRFAVVPIAHREQLERIGCTKPGCDCGGQTARTEPLFITPSCHPNGRIVLAYNEGVLVIVCECGNIVMGVPIASEPKSAQATQPIAHA